VTAYYIDEGAFSLPEGLRYVDRSVNVIEAPGDDGSELQLHIERRPIPEGKSLLDVVREQRDEQARSLRGYAVLREGERTVGGLLALEARLRWRHTKGPVYHVQVSVHLSGVALTLTASSRFEHAETCDAWMEALLSTMQFRPR
jgi:hypothetical protein